MNILKTAISNVKELVSGHTYVIKGVYLGLLGEEYYQTVIKDRIVLFHVSRFKPVDVVSDDEF